MEVHITGVEECKMRAETRKSGKTGGQRELEGCNDRVNLIRERMEGYRKGTEGCREGVKVVESGAERGRNMQRGIIGNKEWLEGNRKGSNM